MVHRRLTLVVATTALLAAGCRPRPPQPTRNAAATAPAAPAPKSAIPLPQPKLEREQVIISALRALSAAALSRDDAKAQNELKGRDFELHLRFGCPGAAADSSRTWSYDEKSHVLRIHFAADLTANAVPASDVLLKGYEGVAGFVIEKPLLLEAGCPAPQFGALNPVEPTIAVAQLFTPQDSRVQRPQRSYEITSKIDDPQKPTQGLDLVIAGRLAGLSDGRVIHCAFAQGPPMCIVAAKFDRVSIENPADGSVLGEWSQW